MSSQYTTLSKNDKKQFIKDAGTSSVTLVCSMLGSSLLSLPYITQKIGWVFQIIIQILILSLNYMYFYYLIEIVHYTGSKSYPEAACKVLNKTMQIILQICIVVSYYGYCTSYTIIASTHIVSFFENVANWSPNKIAVKAIVSICINFPLCLLKNLNILGKVSTIGVLAIFIAAITIYVYFFVYLGKKQLCQATGTYGIRTLPDASPGMQFLYFVMYIPSMWSNFSCHMIVPTMIDELKGPRVIKKKIVYASICIAFAMAAVLYNTVGFIGAAMFGTSIKDNILQAFVPCKFIWLDIVSLLYCAVVIIAFPLLLYPAKIILATLCHVDPQTRKGYWVMAGISAAYVVLSMVLAIVLENIVSIFGLFSAISGIIFYYVVPGVFALKYPKIKQENLNMDIIKDSDQTVDPVLVGILSMIDPVMTRKSVERARALSNKMFPPQDQNSNDGVISMLRPRTFSFQSNHQKSECRVRALSMTKASRYDIKDEYEEEQEVENNFIDSSAQEGKVKRYKSRNTEYQTSHASTVDDQVIAQEPDQGQQTSNQVIDETDDQHKDTVSTDQRKQIEPAIEEQPVVETIRYQSSVSGVITLRRKIIHISLMAILVVCCLIGIGMNLFDIINIFGGTTE